MPSRTFRIYIANGTSVPLTRIKSDAHLHGAFTPGGWLPPDIIPPGQTLAFQAESDGLLQGTDGHVVYQIDDGKTVADCVRIDWNNPWYGVTNSVGRMQVSTGFFEDRTNGDSADFVLEGGGRRPRGEDTGPIITARWTEIVPGLVALPIPNLGVEPHAWSMFAVRDRPSTSSGLTTSFGTTASSPDLDFEPVTGAKARAWQGAWEFGAGDSTVKLTITKNEIAPTSLAAVLGYQQFSASIEEHSPKGGTVSISLPAITEETVNALRYLKAKWPPTAVALKLAPSFTAKHLQTMVSLASTAKSAVSTTPALRSAPRSFRLTMSDLQVTNASATNAAGAPQGAGSALQPGLVSDIGITAPQLLLDEADGFVVEEGQVTLMLYAARNANTGDPMGFGVRYTRRHSDGDLAADVMLIPAFRAPH